MKHKGYLLLASLIAALSACSSGGSDEPTPTPEPDKPITTAIPINISTTLDELNDSRVKDNSFEQGDQIGLFVVNHDANGTAASLKASGNYIDNMCFTYSGTWTPSTTAYWKDDKTLADFYLYYPYTASIESVAAMPFSVRTDQSSEANFKASDALAGSAKNVAPTSNAIIIEAKHLMSQAVVSLAAGNGFTDEQIAASDVSVKINGVKTQATIDIASATPTATGDASSVTAYQSDGSFKAMIVPQTVSTGNLISVVIDGSEYALQKGFTFKSGTRHKFTLTLKKTSSGINVDITGWEDDSIDNGGTAE